MQTMLEDLYGHQAWADAMHWRAIKACPPAVADRAIGERLHHLHRVQQAFLAVCDRRPIQFTKPEGYPALGTLETEVRTYHQEMAEYLGGATPETLAAEVTIPWFKDRPCRLTIEQALYQAAMHSHYHRAQNATRLRELGGVPPTTDLIVWWWTGRPAPEWS